MISRQQLLGALRFTPEGGRIDVRLDRNAIGDAVAPAFAGVVRSPVSASFAISGSRVSVTPSSEGRRIDAEAIARRIERRPAAASVRVALRTLAPERSTADAQRMRIRELVSSFSTPHACCEPRVSNLQRAASILDGQIIPAGGTFSLNTALGERTRARGFVSAPQIGEGGKLEDAVGGGVSQTATTTYNAAFFAGLKIVTHTPHEFWITRYPAGPRGDGLLGRARADRAERLARGDPAEGLRHRHVASTCRCTRRSSAAASAPRSFGDPVEGTAFSIEYTRVVKQHGKVKRDERYSWSYEAPHG